MRALYNILLERVTCVKFIEEESGLKMTNKYDLRYLKGFTLRQLKESNHGVEHFTILYKSSICIYAYTGENFRVNN